MAAFDFTNPTTPKYKRGVSEGYSQLGRSPIIPTSPSSHDLAFHGFLVSSIALRSKSPPKFSQNVH